MFALEDVPWLNAIDQWRVALVAELAEFPGTLRLFRESVSNFQRITKRLLDATEPLEQFAELYTRTVADAGHRMEDAAQALRDQVAGADPGDRVGSAVQEMTKVLSALAELNPLWRRGHDPEDG